MIWKFILINYCDTENDILNYATQFLHLIEYLEYAKISTLRTVRVKYRMH